jgi:hypothetical protein
MIKKPETPSAAKVLCRAWRFGLFEDCSTESITPVTFSPETAVVGAELVAPRRRPPVC